MNNKTCWKSICLVFGVAGFSSVYASESEHNAIQLPPVTVIASTADSTNASQSTLDQEDISQQQAGNTQELLDTMPGISMAGSPRPDSKSLNIRGFGTYDVEDVQIRLDGAPKLFQKYQQGNLFVEPELLKAAEVTKGPHSALYSNGGTGGVVNLTTKDADDLLKPGQEIGAMIKAGSQSNNNGELYSASVFIGGEDNPLDILINHTRRNSDNVVDSKGIAYPYSAINNHSNLFKIGYDFENGHSLNYSYITQDSDGRTPWAAKSGLYIPSQYIIDRYGEEAAIYRLTVWRTTEDETHSLKHEFVSPDVDWLNTSLTLSYSKSEQHDIRPEEASEYLGSLMGQESWTEYNTYFAELKNVQDIEAGNTLHTLTYGLQLSKENRDILMFDKSKEGREDYNGGYFQPWFMPSGVQYMGSLFIQDEISFEKLTVTPSLRYDYIRNKGVSNLADVYNNPERGHDYSAIDYEGFSPRLGMFYKWSNSLAFFSNLSYTFRAPGVDEVYDVGSYQPTSRDLEPEKTLAGEMGLIKSYNDIFQANDNLQIRTSLFYTKVTGSIYRRLGMYYEKDEDGNSLPYQSPYTNTNGNYVYGVEAELFYDSDNVFGDLNTSLMDSHSYGTPRDPNGPDIPMNEVPPPEVNMTLGYKLTEAGIKLGWKGNYAHKADKTAHEIDPEWSWSYALYGETSSYMLHHLFVEWKPSWNGQATDTTVNLFAENITNKDYTPYLSEGVEGVGRNIKVSVTQMF